MAGQLALPFSAGLKKVGHCVGYIGNVSQL
jgi:hypothetical protein